MVIISSTKPSLGDNLVIIPLFENNNISLLTSTLGYFIYDYSHLYYVNVAHPDLLRSKLTLHDLIDGKTLYSTDPAYLKFRESLDTSPVVDINPFVQWHSVDSNYKNYNKVVPLVKLGQKITESLPSIKHRTYDRFFIETMLPVLIYLNQQQITIGGTTYTNNYKYEYIGRPTNQSNQKNLLSLSKEEKSNISSEYQLVEFDYVAYHMHLIAELIGYSFPEDDIYTVIGKDLYSDQPDSRSKAKKSCLVEVYGREHTINHPFFNKINDYKLNFNEEASRNGYFQTNRKIFFDGEVDYRLFSLYLQTLETEKNFIVMNNLIKLLENSQSRLLMYIYDSYILEIIDESELIPSIYSSLSTNGPLKSTVTKD